MKRKSLTKALKKFDGIYVETSTMKKALEREGFENVLVMPNCKKLTVLSENDLIYPAGAPYKLCTFSRVMKEKGIEVEDIRPDPMAGGLITFFYDPDGLQLELHE
jgi:hypothetical protein